MKSETPILFLAEGVSLAGISNTISRLEDPCSL